jgi:hypothetical protein
LLALLFKSIAMLYNALQNINLASLTFWSNNRGVISTKWITVKDNAMNNTTTDGLVSNRLYQVNDVVSAGNYSDDIDDQGTFNNTHSTIETANNYGYDELGNLVRDAQEEIASIEWTVYGKMKKITRNSGSSKADLEFGYDASGNRLWKKVTPKGSGAVISTYYYLRDAQGNEMCRYVKYTNTTNQLMYVAQEHSIYGSFRVGVDHRKDTLYKAGSYSPAWGGANTSQRALGLKSFELANHLGNVLVTVSDKPVYKVSSATIFFQPEITSISDYYPFGAPINGRSYSSSEYRFGYNTQEKIDEISGTGNHNTATFWEYDGRFGRRWNIDPVVKPWESLYAINGDNPIFYTDPNGDFKTWFSAQLYKYSHGGRGHVSKANSGIHKGEWSVSQKVHREGGAEGNENRIGDVLIVQQVRWSWWQGGKTKNTQSKGGDRNLSDPKQYPGISIYQNNDKSDMTAVTLPGFGIYIGGGYSGRSLTRVMQHEYGHYLDYRFSPDLNYNGQGFTNFYLMIGVPSLFNATTGIGGVHPSYWTEIRANQWAQIWFGKNLDADFLKEYPLK